MRPGPPPISTEFGTSPPMSITYVYPNVSEVNRGGRGGLSQRWNLARKTGCDLIEMPCDLVKNKTEVNLTGLEIGEFLTEEAINVLYDKSSPETRASYILHTEPSLPRRDKYGMSHQARLCWYKEKWVDQLIDQVVAVCRRLGRPAIAIEIHPGDRRNSCDDLVRACARLLDQCGARLDVRPQILLENRTGQFVSTGDNLRRFWNVLRTAGADIIDEVGIVLDVQQLYTATRGDFDNQFAQIPLDAIKGVHIHTKHQTPTLEDNIPWRRVFDRLREKSGGLLVNPEVHHSRYVPAAIAFCEKLFSST